VLAAAALLDHMDHGSGASSSMKNFTLEIDASGWGLFETRHTCCEGDVDLCMHVSGTGGVFGDSLHNRPTSFHPGDNVRVLQTLAPIGP